MTEVWRNVHGLPDEIMLPAGVLAAHHQGWTSAGDERAQQTEAAELSEASKYAGEKRDSQREPNLEGGKIFSKDSDNYDSGATKPEPPIGPAFQANSLRSDWAKYAKQHDPDDSQDYERFRLLLMILRIADAADFGQHRAAMPKEARFAFLNSCLIRRVYTTSAGAPCRKLARKIAEKGMLRGTLDNLEYFKDLIDLPNDRSAQESLRGYTQFLMKQEEHYERHRLIRPQGVQFSLWQPPSDDIKGAVEAQIKTPYDEIDRARKQFAFIYNVIEDILARRGENSSGRRAPTTNCGHPTETLDSDLRHWLGELRKQLGHCPDLFRRVNRSLARIMKGSQIDYHESISGLTRVLSDITRRLNVFDATLSKVCDTVRDDDDLGKIVVVVDDLRGQCATVLTHLDSLRTLNVDRITAPEHLTIKLDIDSVKRENHSDAVAVVTNAISRELINSRDSEMDTWLADHGFRFGAGKIVIAPYHGEEITVDWAGYEQRDWILVWLVQYFDWYTPDVCTASTPNIALYMELQAALLTVSQNKSYTLPWSSAQVWSSLRGMAQYFDRLSSDLLDGKLYYCYVEDAWQWNSWADWLSFTTDVDPYSSLLKSWEHIQNDLCKRIRLPHCDRLGRLSPSFLMHRIEDCRPLFSPDTAEFASAHDSIGSLPPDFVVRRGMWEKVELEKASRDRTSELNKRSAAAIGQVRDLVLNEVDPADFQ